MLKHVFSEIARLLDGEAVDVGRHTDLTEETRVRTLRLLRQTADRSPLLSELKELVEAHIVQTSIFRDEPQG